MILNEHFIELDGVKYRYLCGGSRTGVPVLFLHGWGSKAESYRNAFDFLAENKFNIVIPDLPGFGFSPAPKEVWGIKEYCLWVNQLVEKLGWSRYILAGHSFGGRLTIFLAANNPEKLRGIVLYASAGITPRNQNKLSILNYVAKIGKKIMRLPGFRLFFPLAEKFLYYCVGNTDYLYAGEKREIFKKVIGEDLSDYVKMIKVPTKLLWGRNDQATPIADALFINNHINGSELKIIENVGHVIHTQNPKLFADEFGMLIERLNAEK